MQRWLLDFQRAIRGEDYEQGRKLFHPNVVAFGTSVNRADSLDALEECQWKVRWPNNASFEYLVKEAKVIPAPGMFVVAIEWFVKSKIIRGSPRTGRATIVLGDFEGKLLGLHTHHSKHL